MADSCYIRTMTRDRLTPKALKDLVGKEVGLSDWLVVAQDRVDAFAACTGDRQWIHVDRDRAAKGPLGGTVAHGFLLLSLLPLFLAESALFRRECRMAVNYGLNRVRFVSPVLTGARVRNRAVLKEVARKGFRRMLVTIENTIEIEGKKRPAAVAESLVLVVF
jgi:acyl dehydratase